MYGKNVKASLKCFTLLDKEDHFYVVSSSSLVSRWLLIKNLHQGIYKKEIQDLQLLANSGSFPFGEHQGRKHVIQQGHTGAELIGMEKSMEIPMYKGSCKKAVTIVTVASQTVLNDGIYFSIITQSFPVYPSLETMKPCNTATQKIILLGKDSSL